MIRMKEVDEQVKIDLEKKLTEKFGPLTELYFRSVGPSVGKEVTQSAFTAIAVAAAVIVLFILVSFRKVPNAIRYGVCAVVAILQNILVVAGLFSILGWLLGWEVDALFLTAVLTVIGFSVQDIIVVFDRIRENIPKRRGEDYETIVNRSLLETLHRSLATQLNAMFVLVALLLFGGATIKQFVLVLLVGMLSETYASLFSAVPLLVVWEKGEIGGFFRRLFKGRPATA
jgi:preprotein translocase SecF subunit